MKPKGLILAAALMLAAGPGAAEPLKVGAIEIDQPWARATPRGATTGAGYMKIVNTGTEADRLVGGSVAFASRLEVHSMTMDQGVMKMREVAGGLEIKPGETVELKPGGYHVMFVDLKAPLKQGDRVKVTLTFAKAGSIAVDYPVEAVGAEAPAMGRDMKMDKMGH
ncbi:MAG TPA: copper chaperone PCu(A)C [Xanthobacteraceae bacterium]|nr:copper chaperone PCu(A)C [Xanthobacteraceae bacterium]